MNSKRHTKILGALSILASIMVASVLSVSAVAGTTRAADTNLVGAGSTLSPR